MATVLNTTGGGTYTLAAGTQGQTKIIVLGTDSGTDAVITPTNLAAGTTITLSDVGDSVIMYYTTSKWYVLSNQGGVIA